MLYSHFDYLQIIDFYPTIASEDISSFIHANSYSILLFIAFDQFIGQFSKDKERMNKISEKLKKSMTENQE